MKTKFFIYAVGVFLAGFFGNERVYAEFVIDRFSSQTESNGIPKGWEELTFKKIPNHTRYTVVQEGNNFVLQAVSRNSSSGILKKVPLNPKDYPILKWQWKVENILSKADAKKKSGDDYPARIYVAFKYDPTQASLLEKAKYGTVKKLYGEYPPQGALNYIWDNRLPVGTALDNAYTDRAKMIVVESGRDKIGQWVSEEKNIYEDYKRIFGSEPPEIEFIAVMSDTDNTEDFAVAYFDNIVLENK